MKPRLLSFPLVALSALIVCQTTSCRLLKPSDVEQASSATEGHAGLPDGVEPLPARGLKAGDGPVTDTFLTRGDAVINSPNIAGSEALVGLDQERTSDAAMPEPGVEVAEEIRPAGEVLAGDEHPVIAGGSPFGSASAQGDGLSSDSGQILSAVGNGGSPTNKPYQFRGQLVSKLNAEETTAPMMSQPTGTPQTPNLEPFVAAHSGSAPLPSPTNAYPYPVPSAGSNIPNSRPLSSEARPQMAAAVSELPPPVGQPPLPVPAAQPTMPTASQLASEVGAATAESHTPASGATGLNTGPQTSEFEHSDEAPTAPPIAPQ